MKKTLLILSALFSVTVLSAFTVPNIDMSAVDKAASAMADAKDQQDQTYPSTGASQDGVVKFTFEQVIHGNNYKKLTSKKECNAVVIHNNWVLASHHCGVTDSTILHADYMGAGSAPETNEYQVYYKDMNDPKVEGIAVDKVFSFGSLYLLYVTDAKLVAKLAKRPKANILTTNENSTLEAYQQHTTLVKRESYVFSINETQERSIASLCTETNCIEVEHSRGHTDAKAGDPLFFKLLNNQEFIAAFNSAQNYSEGSRDRRHGRKFKGITKAEGQEIIKKIEAVSPEAAQEVKAKIVNEIIREDTKQGVKYTYK